MDPFSFYLIEMLDYLKSQYTQSIFAVVGVSSDKERTLATLFAELSFAFPRRPSHVPQPFRSRFAHPRWARTRVTGMIRATRRVFCIILRNRAYNRSPTVVEAGGVSCRACGMPDASSN